MRAYVVLRQTQDGWQTVADAVLVLGPLAVVAATIQVLILAVRGRA